MRRQEREIKERKQVDEIIRRAQVCRIGLAGASGPYVVPVNFGYDGSCIYFHCAHEGRKLVMIKADPRLCVEFELDYQLVAPEGPPCKWTAKYRSVVGFGRASIIEGAEEKSAALNLVCQHYGSPPYRFSAGDLARVTMVKVSLDSLSGKQSGY